MKTRLPSNYAAAGCLSAETISEYTRDFKLKNFPRLNPCDAKNPMYQILVAIDIMKKMRFSDKITSYLDQGLTDTDYYEFFSKRIHEIRFADTEYNGVGAYYSRGRGRSYLSLKRIRKVWSLFWMKFEDRD